MTASSWTSNVSTRDSLMELFDSTSSSINGEVSEDPTMAKIEQLLEVLMNMTCDQRRFVLSQPSFDGRSTLFDLMHSFLPWTMTLGCGEEINDDPIPLSDSNDVMWSAERIERNPMDNWIELRVHQTLLLYVPMIIFTIGVLGNTLSFGVLTSRRMRRVSAYTYLAVLAVADNLVLAVGLLPVWIDRLTGSDVKDRAAWICRLISVVGVTVSDYSVWLIVAVTVERYIVVCHPLRAASLCQRRTALRVAAIILALVLTININLSWTMDLRQHTDEGSFMDSANEINLTLNHVTSYSSSAAHPWKCTAASGYEYLIIVVWPWVDACIYSMAPFTTLVVLNVLITRQVVTARRQAITTTKSSTTSSLSVVSTRVPAADTEPTKPIYRSIRSGSRPGLVRPSTSVSIAASSSGRRLLVSATGASTSGGCLTESNAVQLGVILATITIAFLITTLPMTIVVILKALFESLTSPGGVTFSTSTSFYSSSSGDGRGAARLILARTISELLMYTNHSLNFFLYCAAGEKFRRELVTLWHRIVRCCRPKVIQRNNEIMSTGAMDNQSNVVMLAVITTDKSAS